MSLTHISHDPKHVGPYQLSWYIQYLSPIHLCPYHPYTCVPITHTPVSLSPIHLCPYHPYTCVPITHTPVSLSPIHLCPYHPYTCVPITHTPVSLSPIHLCPYHRYTCVPITLDRASSLHRDGHRPVNILVAPEQILKPLWKALPWPYIRTKYC